MDIECPECGSEKWDICACGSVVSCMDCGHKWSLDKDDPEINKWFDAFEEIKKNDTFTPIVTESGILRWLKSLFEKERK